MEAFTASDDASFRNLTSQGLIAKTNALFSLRPSSLNFTSACVATLDLVNRNASVDATSTAEQLAIGSAFLELVPSNFTDATIFDAISYWHTLGLLPATQHAMQDALTSCQTSGQMVIPLSELDFTNDCSATSHFWWRFVAPDPSDRGPIQSSDALNLFLPALPPSAASISNTTAMTVLGIQAASSAVAELVSKAADSCTIESCMNLSYQGDSDIGGLGAVISYTSIALFTTIVCVVCAYYYRKDDGLVEMTTASRRAAVKSSLNFADTVTYFAIMTALASDIYVYNATTLYEFSLASLVGSMAFGACSLLSLISLFPMEIEDAKVRDLSRWLAITIAQNVSVPTLSRLNNFSAMLIYLTDMPCYASNVWPLPIIITGATMVVVAWLPYTMLIVSMGIRSHCEEKGKVVPWMFRKSSHLNAICLSIGLALSILIVWYSIGAIFYIRWRARDAFGTSFQDNNFGYGQIIASGFVLQVIVQYATIRLFPKRKKPSAQNIANLAEFNRRETKLSRMTDESRSGIDSNGMYQKSKEEDPKKLKNSPTSGSEKTVR